MNRLIGVCVERERARNADGRAINRGAARNIVIRR
jgi:hypothetical protein